MIIPAGPSIIWAYPPPPFYKRITERFPEVKGAHGILYAWGDRVYNPSKVEVSGSILAHEKLHCDRQIACLGGVDAWWESYLTDNDFMFHEELLAHRAEWQHVVRTFASENQRRRYLARIVNRLAGPLYNNAIDHITAARLIKETP